MVSARVLQLWLLACLGSAVLARDGQYHFTFYPLTVLGGYSASVDIETSDFV